MLVLVATGDDYNCNLRQSCVHSTVHFTLRLNTVYQEFFSPSKWAITIETLVYVHKCFFMDRLARFKFVKVITLSCNHPAEAIKAVPSTPLSVIT